MTRTKLAAAQQRLKALSGPLNEINDDLKLIFADLLLQRPPDPFAFVANRLRRYADKTDIDPADYSSPKKNGKRGRDKTNPATLPVMTDAQKRKRRGMQPPEDLIKFYLNSYRFQTGETVNIFRGLADDEWTRTNGRLTTTMPIFARVTAANASYCANRIERRMSDRLFDGMVSQDHQMLSYLRIIPGVSALAALSVGAAEDRVRAAFYFHGHKFNSAQSSKSLPKAAQTAQVLINFFKESLRCTQNLELAGLGTHVRHRLQDQYKKDRDALERCILTFVKKLYPKPMPGDTPSKYVRKVTFGELCRRLFVPSCWMDTWVHIWDHDKHPDVRSEHPDIIASRWVKAVLFSTDTAVETYSSDISFDVSVPAGPNPSEAEGRASPVEFSPRLDIEEEAERERAVVKMQSLRRGKMARKRAEEKMAKNESKAAVKMQSQFRGHRVRLEQAKKYAEETDAATKLQSRFRGFAARKSMKDSVLGEGGEKAREENGVENKIGGGVDAEEGKTKGDDFERGGAQYPEKKEPQGAGEGEERAEESNTIEIPNSRGGGEEEDWDGQMDELESVHEENREQQEAQEYLAVETLAAESEGAVGKKTDLA
jgi:hypothetical protein